jgi:hypothetical protein
MARQRRRGGGFSPPELRGTLGTLLRTTLQQAGVVRDVLERGAREGRSRLDDLRTDLRSSRRRQEALAELGEIVLELIRRGEIDIAELPEARAIVDHLEELDEHEASNAAERDSSPTVPPPSRRSRFDDREAPARDDGTVSSSKWTPPPRRPGKPTTVWKPNLDATPPAASDDLVPPTNPGHKRLPTRDPARKGGISFDEVDEDDLADYMHPDDVPPKKDE